MVPKPKTKSAKHLGRASSEVHHLGASGTVVRNYVIWTDLAPSVKENPESVFAKCLVLPGSSASEVKVRQIEPTGFEDQEFTIPKNRCYNANDESVDPCSLRDIGLLQHQNTAAVLHFLRKRFMDNQIYTTADPLLVAINPFRDIGVYTDAWIAQYRDVKDIRKLPPHSFAVAREALDNLHNVNKSQTIIVTGESGAGKTEATKHCMRFFASAKTGIDLRIQNAVMAANPVLESFGNAKTIRNNNSSRFGRFMQLLVGAKGGIRNGKVQGFLLEKVRVVSQQPDERSYHIFYQFIKGATAEERSLHKLQGLKDYKNLVTCSGGCFDAPGIDDVKEMMEVRKALISMQLTSQEIQSIFSIVSGVLKLGNVEFIGRNIDGQDDAAEIESRSMDILREACGLLYLDDFQKVADGLRSTWKQIGGENVTLRVQKREAYLLCASLGKAMYDTLFKWIIRRLNRTIEPENGFDKFMGMLDIFGFEIFEENSLEQLLINITNEFLQKNFVDIVFERESRLYREEGVSTAELVFTDNRDVIDCLIGKRSSVFACLEDACVAKSSTDATFHSSMSQALQSNKCFLVPQGASRDFKFVIVHTIAEIEYSAANFISKNMDILKAELTEVAQSSSNPVVHQMFEDVKVERGKLPRNQLIASQFLSQLDEMMKIIMLTEPHFIRCVKPNESKKPLDWVNEKVLNQLFSLSILEALQLKKLGFSWRRPFVDFIYNYRYLNLAIADEMESAPESQHRLLSKQMLTHMKNYFSQTTEFVEGKHWQMGKTMVFLKPDTAQNLMLLQRQAMEDWVPSVILIEAMYKRHLAKLEAAEKLPSFIRVQSRIRRKLCQMGVPASPYDPHARGGAVLTM